MSSHKPRRKLDLPEYLRVRAARARHDRRHLDARVYSEAAEKIEVLETILRHVPGDVLARARERTTSYLKEKYKWLP